ncbi:hypothetical protein, partial [Klebsiella pneumoniae]|uniref:hypothetical protein n=1 Tax=Klebsiella pneumoniae TaxID=573 RepID=UPI001D0DF47B
ATGETYPKSDLFNKANQLFTGIVGCGLTSRGNGADFGILRMDFIKSCFVKISAETALAA